RRQLPSWQSIWQSGSRHTAGRDATGWTVEATRPAAMRHGSSRRTGRVLLLIRKVQVRVLPGAQNRRSGAWNAGRRGDAGQPGHSFTVDGFNSATERVRITSK